MSIQGAATFTEERSLSVYEMGWIDLHVKHRPQNISGLCLVDGDVTREFVLGRIAAFIQQNPQYQRLLIPGRRAAWKPDPGFSLENHIEECRAADLAASVLLGRIGSQAADELDGSKPLWNVTIYRAPESDVNRHTAIAFRAHHSLTDGLGARRLFESILDVGAMPQRRKFNETERPSSHSRSKRRSSTLEFAVGLIKDFSKRRHRDPFLGSASAQREVIEVTWSREQLQLARKRLGASLQELLLVVFSRGLQLFCNSLGHVGELRAIVPMADVIAARDGASPSHHDIGYLDLPLPARTMEIRMNRIRDGIRGLQERQRNQVFVRLSKVLAKLPGGIRFRAAHRWSTNANLLISLIPAGPVQQSINGARITALYGLPALPPGQAIAIGIVIDRNNVHCAVILDPQMVREHQRLETDLHSAYREIVTSSESGES